MRRPNLSWTLPHCLFLLFLMPDQAWSSAGIKEFASPLQLLLDTLQGPLAKVILIFMLILCGIGYYFSRGEEISGLLKALIGVVFAMTLIAMATSIVVTMFPSVGGAVL